MKMSGISGAFYKNGRLLLLTTMLILVAGLSAMSSLPRLEDPRLRTRVAYVFTYLPGASAERVESLVSEKIEESLDEVTEIKHVTSISRSGISVIIVELQDQITATDEVWSKVRDRLNSAEVHLPPEASKPDFDDQRAVAAYTLLTALTWELDDPPQLAIMRRLAEELETQLRGIAGTEVVRIHGEPEEEVTVTVDAAQLAALGLSAEDIARSVTQADAKVAAGSLRSQESDLLMEVRGKLQSLQRIGRIPLGDEVEGQLVRLTDVARIEKSQVDPPRGIAIIDGERAVAVAARVDTARRVDLWNQQASVVLDRFEASLPAGIKLQRVFQQSDYTTARLNNLALNLIMGAMLVVLAILLIMGWRSALLVASALPLTVAIVLFGLQVLGIPLHQMSITGLIIALGLLIDTAIVVVDDVTRHLQQGESPLRAIQRTVNHLFVPLLGSTLTTVIAFMPIILLAGNSGEFVGPMGMSVILALLGSFFVSMTIVPALVGLFGQTRLGQSRPRWWRVGLKTPRLANWLRSSIEYAARRPLVGVAIASVLPIIGFLRAGELKDQFFPAADRDQFHIQVRMPSESSIHATQAVALRMSETIRQHEGITELHWFIGESAPSVYYNMLMNEDGNRGFAEAVVRATDPQRALELIDQLQDELDSGFPEAQTIVRRLGQGPPVQAPFEVRFYGPSLDVLRQLGEQARGYLATTAEVLHTRATLDGGEPKLWVNASEEEVRLAGLTLRDVARQLHGNLEGTIGGSLVEEIEELPVRIRFENAERGELARIGSTQIVTPAGDMPVPLTALGNLELAPEIRAIPRRNGERCNTVQGYIAAEALPQEVLKRFQKKLAAADFQLPPGYRMELGGDAEQQQDAVRSLFAYVGVLMVLMLAVVVLSFNSFRLAILLAVVGLFSVGLALLATWLFGFPLGFMSLIGTSGLIGVALNDSIVVLAGIRGNPRAAQGDPRAIADVVMGCSRHLLATTVTTMGGFVPLLLDGGGFWPPLAVVIAGGVAGATIVALFYIPAGYVLLMCRRVFNDVPLEQRPPSPVMPLPILERMWRPAPAGTHLE